MTPRPRLSQLFENAKVCLGFFCHGGVCSSSRPPSWCRQSCQLAEDPPSLPTILANHPPTSQQTLSSSLPLTGRKASVYFWCQRSIRAKELHSVAKLFFSWSVREGRLVGLWAWSAGRPWPAAVMQWCCYPVALQRLERTPTSTGEGHANPTSQLLHLSERLRSESLVNVPTSCCQ